MRIAIEGCTHGELEITYKTLKQIEDSDGQKVDLLLCCGDFQSTRNLSDLACMACPDKYKSMCSFYKYYSGEAIAPILTIFIGGNHEASNYLQELAYGGWVAPNIYYLGYAGVVEVNGVRIGGLSGIFKSHDYLHGHHECPPYDESTSRSAYHIRNVDVFRLKQLADNPPDIMLSHDWPNGVTNYGDVNRLLRFKKHFRSDIEQNRLGSQPTRDVMDTVKPEYWFSAHLHCKFAAIVPHDNSDRVTKFLALDKCLPRRQFLQVVEIGQPLGDDDTPILRYCPHWLAILKATNHLLSVEKKPRYTPGPGSKDKWDFKPSNQDVSEIRSLFKDDLDVPYNFEQTALAYKDTGAKFNMRYVPKPQATTNSQTTIFCTTLGIHDPMALLLGHTSHTSKGFVVKKNSFTYNRLGSEPTGPGKDSNEIDISEIYDDNNDNNDKDKIICASNPEDSEVTAKANISPICIPQPKNESSQESFLAVIENMSAREESNEDVKADNGGNLFMIDTQGNSSVGSSDNNVVPEPEGHQPVKKLKRRNASMYTSNE